MGQEWSGDASEDGRVARAEEALDELVWDATEAITIDKVEGVMDSWKVRRKADVASLKEAMKARQNEQNKKYEFYRDRVGESSDGSYVSTRFMMFHCTKRMQYNRVWSCLNSIESLKPED